MFCPTRNHNTSRIRRTSRPSKSKQYTLYHLLNSHVDILGKIHEVIANTESHESTVDIVMDLVAYIILQAAFMYITEEVVLSFKGIDCEDILELEDTVEQELRKQ